MSEKITSESIKAGKITAQVRDSFARKDLIGMNIFDICEEVENEFRKMGAEPGFPSGVSVNSTTAHHSAELDETRIIQDGDVIKLDIGAHIDGYLADTAITISYNYDYEQLKKATEDALNQALSAAKIGVRVGEIGKIIEDTASRWGFQTIKNLSGHSIDRYVVHSGVSIPNVWSAEGPQLKEGSIYAIEPFLTDANGAGYVVNGKPNTIFSLITRKRSGDKKADEFVDQIWNTRKTLPFSPRWYLDQYSKVEIKEILNTLVKKRIITAYPDLIEANGYTVCQFEHTFTPTENGANILTKV